MNPRAMSEQDRMIKDISTIDFVMVELALYLDTHPYDRDALDYFHHYSTIKRGMMKEFAVKFFPLTLDTAENCKEWAWGLAPAPWEGVC